MRTVLGLLALCLLLTAPAVSADVTVGVESKGHDVTYSGPTNCPLQFIIAPNPTINGGGWNGDCELYVTP